MKTKHARRKVDLDSDLNLVPMLDLFLSLIPFLLMSTVLASFGGIFVEAPKQGPQAAATAQDSNSKKWSLAIAVDKEQIRVSVYEGSFERKLAERDRNFLVTDREAFKAYIQSLKTEATKITSSLFRATSETRYEVAVSVLSALREAEASESLVLAVGARP